MLTLIKRMEIQLTPQFLKERGISLLSLANPFALQENLNKLMSEIPSEYFPANPDVSIMQRQNNYSLSYELERIPVASVDDEELPEPVLSIDAEADVEVLLDQAVFTVNDNRFCKKQTLSFVNTPMSFVREYLEKEDCVTYFRHLNAHVFEVTIMPKMD